MITCLNLWKSHCIFCVNRQDGFEITDRTVEGQFWINVFMKEKQLPSGLKMTATLEFKNEADAKAYANVLSKGLGDDTGNRYFNSKEREDSSVNFSVS